MKRLTLAFALIALAALAARDQTTFAVFESGAELTWRVSDSWHVGVQGSYRSTSPVRLLGTRESLLQEFNYGLTVKWQFL